MPKAEKGTPKWIATQWKKKGLSKLRWYCGLCGVACKDGNGFAMHMAHENHLIKEAEAEARQANRDTERRFHPDAFSEAFERNFLRYLAKEKIGQRVSALEIYKDLHPGDRQQKDMEKTCWQTLGRFVSDLRERGEVLAERGDHGWFVTVHEDSPCAAWASLPDAEAREMRPVDERRAPRAWNEARNDDDDDDAKRRKRLKAMEPHEHEAFRMAERAAAERQADGDVDEDAAAAAEPPEGILGKVAAFKMFAVTAAPRLQPPLGGSAPSSTAVAQEPPSTWAREDLVVKVRKGSSLGAAFDKKKCIVVKVCGGGRVTVEAVEGAKRGTVHEDQLETVVPAIGKPVRIVSGAFRGAVATLVELRLDDFCAKLQLQGQSEPAEATFPYEHFCRESGLKHER
ncbi:hypothetical protein M885DRAFT_506713 [Pelagophyceae sp. CCMP2097]|nr:hypothetical protein M885DRAFT_506713 [Pelagophyceae sp. CCMP2097]